jgi:TRAP-type C4-dicarboxylate transport system substrate-binding protein
MSRSKVLILLALSMTVGAGTCATAQETIRLRIASGHAPTASYVGLLTNFFVPEATKRIAERTKHKVQFVEGYGGAMVKTSDTLEGIQSGIIDIGAYNFGFEPSNLPLHAFQIMLPFGTMSPKQSLQVARAVYDKVPYMTKVLEDKFNQKLLGLAADTGYNLGTTFEWNSVADIKGQKIAGAGLNLKWLEYVGAVPVQSTFVEAYTGLKTGVYNGWIMFPTNWISGKLYEPAKYYTEIGFGAITWHGITINKARWNRLPKEIQDILMEVALEYEKRYAQENEDAYPKLMAQIGQLAVVRKLPDSVREDWAKSLAEWPATLAKQLDAQGVPGSEVLETAIVGAEQAGYKWPVRYKVK